MFRKLLIGLATITAIGIASVPLEASARGGGGGHGGGGGFHGGGGGAFHGGGMAMHGLSGGGIGAARFASMPGRASFGAFSGRAFHHHHFRNFVSFGIVAPYAYADYPYYDDCYGLVRVRTYHGWRWRQAYVCG
jgi:hypothetical protein